MKTAEEMLREALQRIVRDGKHAQSSLPVHLATIAQAALDSTPPPTQQWVKKEVADKVYTELSNLYQNGCLDLSHDWMDDINKALTAYEQETK